MYKISILFLDREFEHDVYELIRAFYSDAEYLVSYDTAEEKGDIHFEVRKVDDSFEIKYESPEHKGVASASIIKGQSKDALCSCDMTPVEQEKQHIYRVQVGAYSKRAGAETLLKELAAAGFKGIIVKSEK